MRIDFVGNVVYNQKNILTYFKSILTIHYYAEHGKDVKHCVTN